MSGAREQVGRLLSLVPYLQKHQVSVAEVAAEFGVTASQIRQDLNVLWYCGLPGLGPGDLVEIDFEALEDDPDGVVRIANADYLSRPIRLGSSEAAALMVALRTLRESSTEGPEGPREIIDRALGKLEAATAGVGPAVEVHARPENPELEQVRTGLHHAIAADRQLRIEYFVPSRDEVTTRVVDPIALHSEDRAEYLDAWCHQTEGRRWFRLDRILDFAELGEARTAGDLPPRDFSQGLFEPRVGMFTARLLLHPGARWVADYYPSTPLSEHDDGSLELAMEVADPHWLVRFALQLAPYAELLEPAELRTEVADTARSILALYPPA